MKIITLTLNPAFDIHCYTKEFKPFLENLADIISNDAGGKGINISRALKNNGIENLAYVVVGNENKDAFLQKLRLDDINYKEFEVLGRIRENITLHTESQPETRISFSGFSADRAIIDRLKAEIMAENLEDSIVTFTGRAPEGLDIGYIKEFLIFLKSKGAKVVIDSRSFTVSDILDVAPWLIKPNEEEIKMYSDIDVKDEKTACDAAKALKEQGIENVIISLGGGGAVLCCDEDVYFAKAPKISVVSTIGAGDSMIAGFIGAYAGGNEYKEAFKNAVAYGSAACLAEGTNPPDKKDIKKLFNDITVVSL